jgi:SAM-dependent methyltransferase
MRRSIKSKPLTPGPSPTRGEGRRGAARPPVKKRGATRPWYETAFAQDYLARYAHRCDEAAAGETAFVVSALKLKRGALILDLCCGAGRHSRALAKRGYRVIGIDLSQDLLRKATECATRGAFYARGDMRCHPLAPNSVDAVVNFFTSFGYFERDSDNAQVLREVARVLKHRGVFILDFLNITATRKNLVPESERWLNGARLLESRRYDAKTRRLCKTTRIVEGRRSTAREESVRAYTRAELAALFKRSGLKVVGTFGDLTGSRFVEQSSPRCVLLAKKAGRGRG